MDLRHATLRTEGGRALAGERDMGALFTMSTLDERHCD